MTRLPRGPRRLAVRLAPRLTRGLPLLLLVGGCAHAPARVPQAGAPTVAAPTTPVPAAVGAPAPVTPRVAAVVASPGATPVASAGGTTLTDELIAITQRPGVSRGVWGVVVESLDRQDRLAALNARQLLVPASAGKMIAVAAAVDAVGWDHRFSTTLQASGPIRDGVLEGDLWVVGGGDPSVDGRGGQPLADWVAAVRRLGITRITGRLIGDDDAMDEPRPGAMWAWDDLAYPTGAIYGALNVAENRTIVTVTPGAQAGEPTVLTFADGRAPSGEVRNLSVTTSGRQALIWPEQRPGEARLTIDGTLPVGARPVRLGVAVGNPTLAFARALREALQAGGVTVDGAAVDVDDLASLDRGGLRLLDTLPSPPLSTLARPLLKESINLYGEAFLRLATGEAGSRTNDAALAALRARLSAWGLEDDAIGMVDGSGLSRRDVSSTEGLVAVLRHMYDPTMASPWMTGLPIAGRDGTLRNRLRDTAAESNVRAKTGTMSNIRSLAGYVRTRDGEMLAFAAVVNNFEGTGAQAVGALDAIAVRLAEFSRRR